MGFLLPLLLVFSFLPLLVLPAGLSTRFSPLPLSPILFWWSVDANPSSTLSYFHRQHPFSRTILGNCSHDLQNEAYSQRCDSPVVVCEMNSAGTYTATSSGFVYRLAAPDGIPTLVHAGSPSAVSDPPMRLICSTGSVLFRPSTEMLDYAYGDNSNGELPLGLGTSSVLTPTLVPLPDGATSLASVTMVASYNGMNPATVTVAAPIFSQTFGSSKLFRFYVSGKFGTLSTNGEWASVDFDVSSFFGPSESIGDEDGVTLWYGGVDGLMGDSNVFTFGCNHGDLNCLFRIEVMQYTSGRGIFRVDPSGVSDEVNEEVKQAWTNGLQFYLLTSSTSGMRMYSKLLIVPGSPPPIGRIASGVNQTTFMRVDRSELMPGENVLSFVASNYGLNFVTDYGRLYGFGQSGRCHVENDGCLLRYNTPVRVLANLDVSDHEFYYSSVQLTQTFVDKIHYASLIPIACGTDHVIETPGETNSQCSDRGSCNPLTRSCDCFEETDKWAGPMCTTPVCDGLTNSDVGDVCNGHGTCGPSPGDCLCVESYEGAKCDVYNPIRKSNASANPNIEMTPFEETLIVAVSATATVVVACCAVALLVVCFYCVFKTKRDIMYVKVADDGAVTTMVRSELRIYHPRDGLTILGHGGTFTVISATKLEGWKPVAVKLVEIPAKGYEEELDLDTRKARTLIHEWRMSKQFRGMPNVIQSIGLVHLRSVNSGSYLGLVMERGDLSLFKLLKESKKRAARRRRGREDCLEDDTIFDFRTKLDVMYQVANGLVQIHERDYVHRDLFVMVTSL